MGNRDLVGRCGIYCGACPIYRGTMGDEQAREFARVAWKTPPNKMTCGGCHNLGSGSHGVDCPRRKCMDSRGYGFCSECPEFAAATCRKFEQMDEYFNNIRESLREHLRRITSGDADTWLREQGEKWRCGSCGTPVFWEEKTCHCCGKPLK